MGLEDFCYAYFGKIGRALHKISPGIGYDMDAACMQTHPEVYLSMIGFATIISGAASFTALLVFLWFIGGLSGQVMVNPIIYVIFSLPPLMVLLMGLALPKISVSNRISGLKVEIPYASMYISIMARGGLSPYSGLLRLRRTDLLPKLRDEIKRIQRIVLSTGVDPISAMEKAVKVINLKDYKDLLLGYASTLRTGGDVIHYLYSQTDMMFRKMASQIKAMGENLGSLLEAYIIVGILGALGLYMMYIISLSLPAAAGGGLSQESFFLFSFILLPVISFAFMYIGDTLQISYPVSNWKPYLTLLASVPIGIFLAAQMTLPFFVDTPLFVLPALKEFVVSIRQILNFTEGSEAAIGLAISLTAVALPVAILDQHYTSEEKGILQGITSFLRDLVENRKTGLSPEKCIAILSQRDYGKFSKHLRLMSSEIGWGLPLQKVFEDFKSRVKNWLALVNIYLLVDTLSVGGGSEETLETLAEFSESMRLIEQERRSVLAPLIIIPYIGALLLTATTTIFIMFLKDMTSIAGATIPFITLNRVLLTPLIFHSFMFGLAAGKLVTGKVSSGFKIALYLILLSLAGIWITTSFQLLQFG
ncbi:MAG: type II secretion system F family protein [Candidatus Bathyarchaeia archaeon]